MNEIQSIIPLHQRLADNDESTWAQWYPHIEPVIRTAVLGVASGHLHGYHADDIVQDVFTELLVNDRAALREFQSKSTLDTYVSNIARRIALDARARSKKLSQHEVLQGDMNGVRQR